MDPGTIVLLSILAIMVMIMLGIPVAYTLAGIGVVGLAVLVGPKMATGHLASAAYGITAQYTWAVCPLFVVIGSLAGIAGITTEAYDAARKWLSRLPGGLAMTTIVASGAFAACCGSTVANAAIFTPLALPEMLKHGYDKRLSAGCITASGTFAAMIPPSIPMVIYSIITNEPLGKMLMAGVIPGLFTVVSYLLGIYFWALKRPNQAPRVAERFSMAERFKSLQGTWGILTIFLVIMVGIYSGWFAPSAAGAVGACATLVLVVLRRKLRWSSFRDMLMETTQVTSTLFLIIIGGTLFSRFWLMSGVVSEVGGFVGGLPIPPLAVICIFLLIILVMGCFLDPPSVMVITLPLMHPIVVDMGFSGIWFGVLMMKMTEIAVITPPVGMNSFIVAAAAGGKVKLEDVFAGTAPFLVLEIITLVVLLLFPQMSLWLPEMMD